MKSITGVQVHEEAAAVDVTPTGRGTAQGGGATTVTLAAGASATDDLYNGWEVRIIGGVGIGQKRRITAYAGATKRATVDAAWLVNPDATSIYVITAPCISCKGKKTLVAMLLCQSGTTSIVWALYARNLVDGILHEIDAWGTSGLETVATGDEQRVSVDCEAYDEVYLQLRTLTNGNEVGQSWLTFVEEDR